MTSGGRDWFCENVEVKTPQNREKLKDRKRKEKEKRKKEKRNNRKDLRDDRIGVGLSPAGTTQGYLQRKR